MTTRPPAIGIVAALWSSAVAFSLIAQVSATPANRAALERHYDKFLAKSLAHCTTCHLPASIKNPKNLGEFPHNPFGARLRALAQTPDGRASKLDLPARLALIAHEDSDGDGVDNETEILLGHNPGDARDTPTPAELRHAQARGKDFSDFLASYHWQPFKSVQRPPVSTPGGKFNETSGHPRHGKAPATGADGLRIRNPIDAFIAVEHRARGLTPRPEAPKEILLRRVYLDLIGISPTPQELAVFEADSSPKAYEKVVDRLLADPRYGERWGRHWMDVWRYSDWAGWAGGSQIRDSKPHIWRWRDWIVESLNADKPYSEMIVEMLAADELAPGDTNRLRATGFLVRNYKMLSREQWLEDTVKHTSQAFLGITMGCAKCHDHKYDPISQEEYYQIRAVFEPHWVRTDHLPGDTNVMNLGLVRAFDTDTNPPTYFLTRGDERTPDTNRWIRPGVPKALGGSLQIKTVTLPWRAGHPDREEFVYRDTLAAADRSVAEAQAALVAARTNTAQEKIEAQELALACVQAQRDSLAATLAAEQLEDRGQKGSPAWKSAATNAVWCQRQLAEAEAKRKCQQAKSVEIEAQRKSEEAARQLASATNDPAKPAPEKSDSLAAKKAAAEKAATTLAEARKKLVEADLALGAARTNLSLPLDEAFQHRTTEDYPTNSTGRRLAFARWLASTNNPLTARVAANQIWLRHFGQGLVPTPQDFGGNGKPPSHPQLLDWLASELMAKNWSMKALHKTIVLSSTYRLAATPDAADAKIDPDNTYLWRMNSRRMEAEVVRDNLLAVAGDLDGAMGGPDIDNALGLKSRRRSIYLRQAAEKEVEFLKIFDGPAVTECYVRRPTVVPQQALALVNSELTSREAKLLAKSVSEQSGPDDAKFARQAFERILARHSRPEEMKLCRQFLAAKPGLPQERARENLVSILFNHNDFVTIR